MSEISTDIAVQSSAVRDSIMDMKNGNIALYSTFKGDTFADKKAVIAALANAKPVAEHIGEILELTNIIVQAVEMENESTKKMEQVPRLVLSCADGESYFAISNGLFKSVENILGIMGEPSTWGEPLPIVIDKIKGGKGFFFTARIA